MLHVLTTRVGIVNVLLQSVFLPFRQWHRLEVCKSTNNSHVEQQHHFYTVALGKMAKIDF